MRPKRTAGSLALVGGDLAGGLPVKHGVARAALPADQVLGPDHVRAVATGLAVEVEQVVVIVGFDVSHGRARTLVPVRRLERRIDVPWLVGGLVGGWVG